MHDSVSKLNKEKQSGKLNSSKRKRIRRKQNNLKINKLKHVGNNADGIMNKLESLEFILKENPSAIFLQEIQSYRPGRIKTPSSRNYTWYELHRTAGAEKGEKGGGIALGVANSLKPSWISEGDNDCEAITVEVWVDSFPVRLVCGYGPQNYDKPHRKEKFWEYLDKEVNNATSNGAGFILQMDGNLWAGKSIIKDDPRDQNHNGKLFENFLKKNSNLTVVNALTLCNGLFTRRRNTKNGVQESVIDFYVVCDRILPLVSSMTIDETGQNSLTRYKGKIVKSDHSRLDLEVDLVFHKEKKHERPNAFNVRNKSCQKKFFEYTSSNDMFTKCFNSDKHIELKFKTWQSKFQKALYACFKKVRLTEFEPKPTQIDNLMNLKKQLLKEKQQMLPFSSEDLDNKLEDIDKQISEECSNKEFEKLVNVVGDLDSVGGGTNSTSIWKQFQKAYPKKTNPIPTGIKKQCWKSNNQSRREEASHTQAL